MFDFSQKTHSLLLFGGGMGGLARYQFVALLLLMGVAILGTEVHRSFDCQSPALSLRGESQVPSESDETSDETDPSEPTEFSQRLVRRQRTHRLAQIRLFVTQLEMRSRGSTGARPVAAGATGELAHRNGIGAPLRC